MSLAMLGHLGLEKTPLKPRPQLDLTGSFLASLCWEGGSVPTAARPRQARPRGPWLLCRFSVCPEPGHRSVPLQALLHVEGLT